MLRLLGMVAVVSCSVAASAAPEPVEVDFDLTGLPVLPFGGETLLATTASGVVTSTRVEIDFTTEGTFQAENLVIAFGGPTGGFGRIAGPDFGWNGQGHFTTEFVTSSFNGEIVMQGRDGGLSFFFLNIAPTANSLPTPVQGTLGPTHIRLTIQPCLVDWTGDFRLSVQDLFSFLTDYFGHPTRADIDGSGMVAVGDLFMFLSLYFAGCDAF